MKGFRTARLKQVVDPGRPITYGIVQCGPDVSPHGIPYVRPVDMTDEGGVLLASLRHTTSKIAEPYRRSIIREGDLVVSIGPSFGKVMVVPPELDGGNLTQGTARIAVGPRVSRQFLFWALRSKPVADAWDASCNGATFRALTLWGLGEAPVPVPPLPTQRAIADFLDRKTAAIDALIEKKERLIALLAEKRAALIHRAVTKGLDPDVPMKDSGVPWIGEIPVHWEMSALRWVRRPGTSITYGIVQAGPDVPDGVPYIRVSEMSGDELPREGYQRTSVEIDRSYARSRVHPGDLVIAIRASVGKVLMVPDYLPVANLTQGTAKVSVRDEVSNHFVHWAVQSEASQTGLWLFAKGATFKEITLEVLRKLKLALPPRHEQETITRALQVGVARLDEVSSKTLSQIDKLHEYRQSLITAAVTGQLDIPGEDAA